jgi:hypothetical protein
MSGGPLRLIADVEQDTPRPLQLQPRIFPQQIFSKGAVARSPGSHTLRRTLTTACGGTTILRPSPPLVSAVAAKADLGLDRA